MSVLSHAPGSTKRLGRLAAATFGSASADWRVLPDFIIAGAQRCGTTSLFRALAVHPSVVPPMTGKGIHYFDTAATYARGLKWYRGQFPLKTTLTRHAARGNGHVATGEASPYYIFHPLAVQRIAEELPSVRIIVLLRDPIERAFSAYKQEFARGFETETFEAALELEPTRLAGEVERMMADPSYQSFAHQHHAYVARGEYAAQLERAFAALGKERVFVAETDELMGGDEDAWGALVKFLGLEAWTPESFTRANARPSRPMPEKIRRRLDAHFAPHDEQLAELLGKVPSWRRS